MMKHLYQCLFFLFTIFLFYRASVSASPDLAPRNSYSIPLMKLSVIDNNTGVRISREAAEDYTLISTVNDCSVKNNRNAVKKTTYRESLEKAYRITGFEAVQLRIVNKSLIATLEVFEKNLRSGKWGHCRYLDAFLPKFLRGYYILIGAAKNSIQDYRSEIALFDGKYEVSLNSLLTDARVGSWSSNPEYTVKLRIATKELIYQLKHWDKHELSNNKRNPDISFSGKAEEALGLFVRIYFSINAPAFVSKKDRAGRFR